MSTRAHINADVLREILRAFASEGRSIPSSQALQEMAAAAGKSRQEVEDGYIREYELAGGEGDPWTMSDHPRRYD